jgi:hypothetical protein
MAETLTASADEPASSTRGGEQGALSDPLDQIICAAVNLFEGAARRLYIRECQNGRIPPAQISVLTEIDARMFRDCLLSEKRAIAARVLKKETQAWGC